MSVFLASCGKSTSGTSADSGVIDVTGESDVSGEVTADGTITVTSNDYLSVVGESSDPYGGTLGICNSVISAGDTLQLISSAMYGYNIIYTQVNGDDSVLITDGTMVPTSGTVTVAYAPSGVESISDSGAVVFTFISPSMTRVQCSAISCCQA
jgi:hypothetical protein